MADFNFMPSSLNEEVVVRIRRRRADDLITSSEGGTGWFFWFCVVLFCLWLFSGTTPANENERRVNDTPTATTSKTKRF